MAIRNSSLISVVVGGISLVWASSAVALEPRYTDNGQVVRWRSSEVAFLADDSIRAIDPRAFEACRSALAAWATVDRVPVMLAHEGSSLSPGFREGGPNENAVIFAPTGMPAAKGALAITILTFASDSGAIVDSDLVVNGASRQFGVLSGQSGDTDDGATEAQSSDGEGGNVYDLQNVLTHEFGHALGLSEDFSEKRATMYAYSSPGETHKRSIFGSDQQAAAMTYEGGFDSSSSSSAAAATGCSSELARGWHSASSWRLQFGVSLVALAAGLLLLRRRKAAERFAGAGTVAASLAFLVIPPTFQNTPIAQAQQKARPDAELTIVGAEARWVDGIIVTRLSGRVDRCLVASCPKTLMSMEVMGGRMGPYTQIVGQAAVPDVGTVLSVRLPDAKSWIEVLHPSRVP